MGSNTCSFSRRPNSLCSCIAVGASACCFEDTFDQSRECEGRKPCHDRRDAQKMKAQHSIQAQGNQHEPQRITRQNGAFRGLRMRGDDGRHSAAQPMHADRGEGSAGDAGNGSLQTGPDPACCRGGRGQHESDAEEAALKRISAFASHLCPADRLRGSGLSRRSRHPHQGGLPRLHPRERFRTACQRHSIPGPSPQPWMRGGW